MQKEQFLKILKKYQDGNATAEEVEFLRTYYNLFELESEVLNSLKVNEKAEIRDRIESRLMDDIANLEHTGKKKNYRWMAIAASILLMLSFGAYLYFKPSPPQLTATNSEQLTPVQNGVTLTLANGQKMVLSKKHSGQIVNINGTRINQEDSLLSYHGKTAIEAIKMNTLTNNGSSKFRVTLSDGTEATLDIGSSLTYPVAFNSTTRVVSMTGQAYFKVKHITGQRFIVKAKDQTTEDIGTEFNINAYDDEPASKTTLIEGSIRVNEQLLKPGQQAVITGAALAIKPADIESVTAWLQGKLIFQKEPLENILKRVARIYGVQIVYQDEEVKKYTYFGSVNSTKKLSSVLNFFRKAGRVDFKVDGKTVKVFKAQKKPTNN